MIYDDELDADLAHLNSCQYSQRLRDVLDRLAELHDQNLDQWFLTKTIDADYLLEELAKLHKFGKFGKFADPTK